MSGPTIASLGERVASGGTADLFPWGEGWLLKLFFDWVPADVVHTEAASSSAAHAAGFPSPATGEVVFVEGRLGLPVERLAGRTMAEAMLYGEGTVTGWARTAAELQAQLHALPAPSIRTDEFWRSAIQGNDTLSESTRARLLARMASLPGHEGLCHGDFHAGNIFVTPAGPKVIDWGAAYRGNVLSDTAQTWVAMTEWLSMPRLGAARAAIAEFIGIFTECYFELRPGGRDEFEAWKPVAAAVRLSVPHPESSERPLLELIQLGMGDES